MKINAYYGFLEKASKPFWLSLIIAIYLLFQYAFDGMFSVTTSHLKQISGYSIPDLMFYYTPAQLETVFQHFGEAGIKEYLNLQLIDMVYPVSYSLLLAVLLYIGYGKTKYKTVVWLPVAAAVSDYTENFILRSMAIHFPEFNDTTARFAAFFTSWKWIFIAVSILLILFAFVKWTVKKVKPAA